MRLPAGKNHRCGFAPQGGIPVTGAELREQPVAAIQVHQGVAVAVLLATELRVLPRRLRRQQQVAALDRSTRPRRRNRRQDVHRRERGLR